MGSDRKNRSGIVYSTDPAFIFQNEDEEKTVTLSPSSQNLRVGIDRKQRKGKTVTLITGFQGTAEDLSELGKMLRTKCGTGGSVKEGEILIQGDFCGKVIEILIQNGYKAKRI